MKTKSLLSVLALSAILVIFLFTLTTCIKIAEDTPPTVTTTTITNITETTATGGGEVTSQGSSSVTARGICWSASSNPTTSDSHTTDGSGTGSFTSNINGLTANTPYYVRAYATNSAGTSYGSQVSFTTTGSGTTPTVTTASITNITETTATGGGNVTAQGSSSVTARGVCWSISANPSTSDAHTADGSGTGNFTSSLTGLTANTPYYVRAYATNSAGTGYGNEITFTTPAVTLPTVTTDTVINITQTTATSGGDVTSDGGDTVTARGVCWSISVNVLPTTADNHTTNGSGTGIFTSNLTGLAPYTKYYVRAYATNSAGTSYGNLLLNFTTLQGFGETVTDIDGNVYHTVTIGTQTWMVENLETTRYNDGTAIPWVTNDSVWAYSTYPKYCWYGNKGAVKSTYGALYNWYAVNTGKLCPTGWHVPSAWYTPTYGDEWRTLIYYCGGPGYAGGKMKSTGTIEAGTGLWFAPNTGATNESGFTAVPGGYRFSSLLPPYTQFHAIGEAGLWWSSSECPEPGWAFSSFMFNHSNIVEIDNMNKNDGLSVRCVRD